MFVGKFQSSTKLINSYMQSTAADEMIWSRNDYNKIRGGGSRYCDSLRNEALVIQSNVRLLSERGKQDMPVEMDL